MAARYQFYQMARPFDHMAPPFGQMVELYQLGPTYTPARLSMTESETATTTE